MSAPHAIPKPWIDPAPDGRRFGIAILLGLLLELGALGLFLPWIAHQVPPSTATPEPVKLSIVSPAPPAPPSPPPPKPLPPPPKPLPPPPPVPLTPPPPALPLPPPVPVPVPHHARRHIPPPRQHPVLAAPTPPPLPQTAPPPPAALPSAPVPTASELDEFAAAMHRALQNALIFPDGAQMAHESGVVRIRFSYLDGAVSDITVIRSCGYPELDQAAVQTARAAHYPPPPPDFSGHIETVDVDVIFPAAAPDSEPD